MHNNNAPPLLKKPQPKSYYTVIEAAVAWARADGASSANSPLINQYTQIILEAVKSGELPFSGSDPTLSANITFSDLKQWMGKRVPQTRPAFLFEP